MSDRIAELIQEADTLATEVDKNLFDLRVLIGVLRKMTEVCDES